MKTLGYVLVLFAVMEVVLAYSSPGCAETVFRTEFEYAGGEPLVDLDAAALNGADGQIGTFSGTLPEGAGGQFEPFLMGFEENPDDFTRLLWVDRAIDDGSFFANLSSEIFVNGATFSLNVGTRRTNNNNHNKDYDVIGRGSAGDESFHLRISGAGEIVDESERLGVVTDDGFEVIYDLPTVDGESADQDLDNLGGPPFDAGEIGIVDLNLGADGYVINFENAVNLYTTEPIPYNGPATTLSQIEFTFAGGDANGQRSGHVLDNLLVEGTVGAGGAALQAGDADQDLDFDQIDLVKVQIAAKYLSGQAATWGEGDWDAAPGGQQGSPPPGNGLFDQLDIIAALANSLYLTGPYAAIAPDGEEGDGLTSIVYNANTGEVGVDAPAGTSLTSVNIDSASGIFVNHESALNLGGSFDNHSAGNIFKATFGSSFESLSFGAVAQPGLAEDVVANDLTVVGSLEGGGGLGDVDLVYVPEPSAILLLAMGQCLALGWRRK